jgi:hypothetical protein
LSVDLSHELAALWEEIDFVAFIRDDDLMKRSKRETRGVQRRRLYRMVLNRVREIEYVAHAVALGGTYAAATDHPFLPEARVAVIGFFPTKTDPAAISRRQLLVPERVCLSRQSTASRSIA